MNIDCSSRREETVTSQKCRVQSAELNVPRKYPFSNPLSAFRIEGITACLRRLLQLCVALCPFVAIPSLSSTNGALVAQAETQKVFGGGRRTVSVTWRNASDGVIKAAISTRQYQVGGSIVAPVDQTSWKTLEILPNQTLLENATLELPAVRAKTRFFVQWLQPTNVVAGLTEVWVYPTNLLHELKALANQTPLGIFDPQNRLKPLLDAADVELSDLLAISWKGFSGHLAIFGPFESKADFQEDLSDTIEQLAKRGVAVVWILPPDLTDKLRPSFYLVPAGKGAVVVVAPDLVADLPERPQAQLNLVDVCRLALHPKSFSLPLIAPRP